MTNRLASEKSPYLLQHKDNPVNWYPWSEEAFEAARREDKPIFPTADCLTSDEYLFGKFLLGESVFRS